MSDFRFACTHTNSLAKRSRSIHSGQFRTCGILNSEWINFRVRDELLLERSVPLTAMPDAIGIGFGLLSSCD
jgi:hypothetical protein